MRDKIADIMQRYIEIHPDIFYEELQDAGVTTNFVRNYIEANLEEIIFDAITEASAIGQFRCKRCEGYFDYHMMAIVSIASDSDGPSGEGICKNCDHNKLEIPCNTSLFLIK